MSVSLLLGLLYLISELLLTVTRRSRSRTGTLRVASRARYLPSREATAWQAACSAHPS